ncbi:MAG TPA: hypothetical protein VIK07_08205 [Bacteroidales bacterium]
MKKNDGRLVGILGTVIIHLIAGIIFMSFQLKSVQRELSDVIEVELAPLDEINSKDKLIELPPTTIERILQGDENMLNIARNMANMSEVKINREDYIDKVKEELIKSGKLGADNYIDEQKRLEELKANENVTLKNDTAKKNQIEKPKDSQEMAANYKGPTRIYYDLKGRIHTSLPVPIYKCQGSGKVVLSIEVNQKGEVEKASVIESESNTADACLIETAVNTALISRFNSDVNSPRIQNGTLTYLFVAQ